MAHNADKAQSRAHTQSEADVMPSPPPEPIVTFVVRMLWGILISPLSGESKAHSLLCIFFIACIALLELEVPNPRHPLNLVHMYASTASSQLVMWTLLILVIIASPLPAKAFAKDSPLPAGEDDKDRGRADDPATGWTPISGSAEGRKLTRRALLVFGALVLSTAIECGTREEISLANSKGEGGAEGGKLGPWATAVREGLRSANLFSPTVTAACAYGAAIIFGLIGF